MSSMYLTLLTWTWTKGAHIADSNFSSDAKRLMLPQVYDVLCVNSDPALSMQTFLITNQIDDVREFGVSGSNESPAGE